MAEGPEAGAEQQETDALAPDEQRSSRVDWGVGKLLVAVLAALFACSTELRAIRTSHAFKNLLLDDPAGTLFVLAEHERTRQRAAPEPEWLACASTVALGCSVDHSRRVWDDLIGDRAQFEAEGWVLEPVAGASRTNPEHARVVNLAGWGDARALEQLRELDDSQLPSRLSARARELLRGEEERDRKAGLRAAAWARWLDGSLLAVWLLGVASFAFWRWRGRPSLARADGLPLARLPLERALTVFLWAHAARAVATRLYWNGAGAVGEWFRIMPACFLSIVVLLLFWATEARGGEGLRTLLHWPRSFAQWATVTLLVACTGGLDFAAALAIDSGGALLGHRSPWSETVDEIIMFGSLPEALASSLDLIVFAPISEELLYRGILFATLLRWMSLHAAALLSAVLFAVWHGYGVIGTLSISVSGYLLALLYARTHSLLPSMLCHALLNLFFSASVFAYRPWS